MPRDGDQRERQQPGRLEHAHAAPRLRRRRRPPRRSRSPNVKDEPPPPPTTGKTVNVAAERGTVTVRLPDGRTVPLDDATQIVTGSVIDTRKGAVRLESRGAGGKIDSGVFSEGLFKVTQTGGAKPVTELALVEPLVLPEGQARERRGRQEEEAAPVGRREGQLPHARPLRERGQHRDEVDGRGPLRPARCSRSSAGRSS